MSATPFSRATFQAEQIIFISQILGHKDLTPTASLAVFFIRAVR